MTRRILIFALLGPALGSVVLAALSGGFPGFLASSDACVIVPGVFAVTLLPFLLCAAIDFFLEDTRWWERLAAAALASFVTSFIAAWMTGAITQHVRTLQLGLVGAIPAMVCSWLAQQRRRRASEARIEGGPEPVGLTGAAGVVDRKGRASARPAVQAARAALRSASSLRENSQRK